MTWKMLSQLTVGDVVARYGTFKNAIPIGRESVYVLFLFEGRDTWVWFTEDVMVRVQSGVIGVIPPPGNGVVTGDLGRLRG